MLNVYKHIRWNESGTSKELATDTYAVHVNEYNATIHHDPRISSKFNG
jgi:hypothetical protein